jgi:hypothetical protein
VRSVTSGDARLFRHKRFGEKLCAGSGLGTRGRVASEAHLLVVINCSRGIGVGSDESEIEKGIDS